MSYRNKARSVCRKLVNSRVEKRRFRPLFYTWNRIEYILEQVQHKTSSLRDKG